MTWAQKRQLTYFLVALGIVIVVIGIPLFLLFYKKPTCFDGKKNGGELDVDCGGSCTRLCKATEIRPVVGWQQAFEVTPGVYNVVAYIQNPNARAQAFAVPYAFTFRNTQGAVVAERKGKAYVPPGKNFAIFEAGIVLPKDQGQIRTFFEFTGEFDWMTVAKDAPELSVQNQQVSEISRAPIVTADIANPSLTNLGRINVVAIVYDTKGNAVAASRTYLDRLNKQSQGRVVFTWPQPFSGQVTSCQQPSDIVLALDRSGSMASDKANPPEPLTSVKNAALSFVDELRDHDNVAVVSFATEATSPIDELLTKDRSRITSSIKSISIAQDGTQYTNIYDALTKSLEELFSNRHRAEAKRAIVLLTDGKPTYPEQKGNATYPADKALAVAREAQSKSVELYTIGLGKDVDDEFMKSVSGFTERYYRAPSASDLVSVYAQIGAALCKLGPAKIEIIPDVVPF